MDEFVKVSIGKKRIIDILDNLRPGDKVEIVADKDGKPDVFYVKIENISKIVIKGQW